MLLVQAPLALGHLPRGHDAPDPRPFAGQHDEERATRIRAAEPLIQALTAAADMRSIAADRLFDLLEGDAVLGLDLGQDVVIDLQRLDVQHQYPSARSVYDLYTIPPGGNRCNSLTEG